MDRRPTRAHEAKFYDRLRLIRSILRVSRFSTFKINSNCNAVSLLHHPFLASTCSGIIFVSHWIFYNTCWLRITDDGLIPEIRIWSMVLIQSDYFCVCIHFNRSPFLYLKPHSCICITYKPWSLRKQNCVATFWGTCNIYYKKLSYEDFRMV